MAPIVPTLPPRRNPSDSSRPRTGSEAGYGAFRPQGTLGRNARTEVLLAKRETLDESGRPAVSLVTFALKRLILDQGQPRREDVEAMVREVEIMRRLDHPSIVRVVDSNLPPESDPYIVMELLDGVTIERLLRRFARTRDILPPALALYIVHEIMAALAHIHEMRDDLGRPLGLVNGHLRPKDVMLLRNGTVKLLAFGSAGATAVTSVPDPIRPRSYTSYRSPEQILGHSHDARADLFSAGALLWELLVGPALFAGKTEADAVGAVLSNEVPPPSSLRKRLPAEVDAIIMRALHRDPNRRPSTAAAMAAELANFLPNRSKLARQLGAVVDSMLGPLPGKESRHVSRDLTPMVVLMPPPPTARTPATGVDLVAAEGPGLASSTSTPAPAVAHPLSGAREGSRSMVAPPPLPMPKRYPTQAYTASPVRRATMPPPLPIDALAGRAGPTLTAVQPPKPTLVTFPEPTTEVTANATHALPTLPDEDVEVLLETPRPEADAVAPPVPNPAAPRPPRAARRPTMIMPVLNRHAIKVIRELKRTPVTPKVVRPSHAGPRPILFFAQVMAVASIAFAGGAIWRGGRRVEAPRAHIEEPARNVAAARPAGGPSITALALAAPAATEPAAADAHAVAEASPATGAYQGPAMTVVSSPRAKVKRIRRSPMAAANMARLDDLLGAPRRPHTIR